MIAYLARTIFIYDNSSSNSNNVWVFDTLFGLLDHVRNTYSIEKHCSLLDCIHILPVDAVSLRVMVCNRSVSCYLTIVVLVGPTPSERIFLSSCEHSHSNAASVQLGIVIKVTDTFQSYTCVIFSDVAKTHWLVCVGSRAPWDSQRCLLSEKKAIVQIDVLGRSFRKWKF